MIFVAKKGKGNGDTVFTQVKHLNDPYPDVLAIIKNQGQKFNSSLLHNNNWGLGNEKDSRIISIMSRVGRPLIEYVKGELYIGIKTGLNKAYWINKETRDFLIHQDKASEEIIKPLIVGDVVRKWHIDQRGQWIIAAAIGVNISKYPAIYKHLQEWRTRLAARSDQGNYWYELRSCVYYDAFEKPKIVFPDIAKDSRFTLDSSGAYVDMTAFVIPQKDLYLLGVLNSSLVWQYLRQTAAVLGDAEKGGRLRLKRIYMRSLPIPNAPTTDHTAITALTQKCLDAKGQGANVAQWEAEIDERVARLYGLSSADLKAIRAEQGKA